MMPVEALRNPESRDGLRSALSGMLCQVDYKPTRLDHVEGSFDGVDLGNCGVYHLQRLSCLATSRRRHHIQADGADDYMVCIPTNGVHEFEQSGFVSLQPGSFALMSMSQPWESISPSPDTSEYVVRVSGPLLRKRVPDIERRCARIAHVGPGPGLVMRSLSTLALSEGRSLGSYSWQFGLSLIDAVAAAVLNAPEMVELTGDAADSPQERLRQKAMRYIMQNLTDPTMSVTLISQHCHCSERSLHGAFAVSGTTVSAFVREARLERSREMLRDPEHRLLTVTAIALQTGFNDGAHFSHLYKARYGHPPAQDRRVTGMDKAPA